MLIPLRVLILEDNPSDAELVRHTLRRAGYDPIGARVETEQDFIAHLQPSPEIILADFSMPELDALRALDIMQERQLDIPFIIVSGTIGEERAVQVMQHGATDYIIKDRLGRLGQAVAQALARWQLKEEKLKADQTVARLAAIVETSGDAILTKTLDGVITTWNRAAEILYGFSAAEIVGKHISILFPRGRRQSDAPEDFDGMMARLARGEHIGAFETVRVRHDGRRIEVFMSISPIRDAMGVVTGASVIALDITQLKRSARFLSAEQAVTGILTESRSLDEAGPRVLQIIAESLRWEVAVLWTIDPSAQVLRRQHFWHATWADPAFVDVLNHRTVLEPGMSVAGRTWSAGEPVWERGILIDGPPKDTEAMTRDGLRCGFGVPMHQGMELVGVIEFYNPELREPDQALVAALDNIACQISQFCERRRTEAALRVSEERYRVLADNLPGGVFTCKPDGACDYCNQWWCDYAGLTEEQVLGYGWGAALHPETRQETVEFWAESTRKGRTFQAEHRFRGADGVYRWFLARAAPLNDEAGRVIKWFGTCVDIDHRKQAEAERDRLFRRLQLQIERMPLAYVLCDADFRIADWNPTAERIFGFARAEMIGAEPPYEKFIPRALWENMGVLRNRIRAGDMEAHSINENLTKDGRTITCHWFNTPLLDKDGQFIGFLCLAQDITAQKSLEEQLRQSQKLEAIGQLAGGVAHDFNNLLTVINGFSEMAMNRMPAGDKARDMLRQVVVAGERAAGLTRQLLAFSRKAIIAPKILDLREVVADLDTMLRRLIGEHIEMSILGDTKVGAVNADIGQVEQVIINLVVNAGDAMPQGGKLTIEVRDVMLDESHVRNHADARAGPHVLLAVSDTGCGIAHATMAKIFEPFFTTKGERGTGLGLATVHGIVKQSGGNVSVYSELGVGTTFKVYLPNVEQPAPALAQEQPIEVLPRGSETVLFVEDEDGVRELGQFTLERSGYTVVQACDGEDALRVAGAHPGQIDLLVTDVVMPRMGGRELAERLALLRPEAKVLFLSGYTDDAVVRHGILQAQVAFLQKPFRPAALILKVREVLDSNIAKASVSEPLAADADA